MSIKMRQLVEREIAHQVIVDLLKLRGWSLGVNDGEETTVHHSRDAKKIEAALFTTDGDFILVYCGGDPKDIRPDYWVRLVYGNDGWDVINDYSMALEPIIGKGTATEKLIEKYGD